MCVYCLLRPIIVTCALDTLLIKATYLLTYLLTYCDKTKATCAHILIRYERTFILVIRHEEWLVATIPCT